MTSFLLDTNIVSEAHRRRPDAHVLQWLEEHSQDELYLSALVVGEIVRGIEKLRARDPAQAEQHERWFFGLKRMYRKRILPVTEAVAEEWGRLQGVRSPLPTIDSLMAATALVHGLTLVSRNVADHAGTGVPLVNPFEPT